jgi:sulfur carrier protein ThiS
MAILKSADQFKYTGKGPLDAKSLVKTYAELLMTSTWTDDGTLVAYNGMIVAVWLDTEANNGIYFLHDSAVTKPIHKPDVTNSANWHKLGGVNDLPGLTEQLSQMQEELEAVQKDVSELKESATEVVELFEQLPETGKSGKLYIVTEDATTYVWHNGKYLLVGDGADEADIQIIHGGSAK